MIRLFSSRHQLPLRPTRRKWPTSLSVPRAIQPSGPIVFTDVRGLSGLRASPLTGRRQENRADGRRFLRGIRLTLATLTLLTGATAAAAPPAAARSAAETPVDVVTSLYRAHAKAFNDKGPSVLDDARRGSLYFAAPVAKRLARTERFFDPLYNGQDAKITDFSVRQEKKAPAIRGVARVIVTFRNFGEPERLVFILFRTRAGTWRIADIVHKRWRLRQLLKMR